MRDKVDRLAGIVLPDDDAGSSKVITLGKQLFAGGVARARPLLGSAKRGRILQFATSLFAEGSWHAQRAVHTAMDRYPEVFAAAAGVARSMREANGGRPLRALSFGCSTGEECFSLRSYFPDDELFGCDINQSVLDVAIRRQRAGGITFFHSASEALERYRPFDVVFCMSSLCLFPDANRASGERGHFPFSAFDDLISEIDRNLAPGGLLVIYNSSYPFRLATAAARYDPVDVDIVVENGFVNKLHRGGRAFTVTESKNHSWCHRMVNAPDEFGDRDFVDCLFRKRDDEPATLNVKLSRDLPPDSELLSKYTMSDEDVFAPAPGLLTAAFDIELLRAPAGDLLERVTYRRKSLNGGVTPARQFVRSVSSVV